MKKVVYAFLAILILASGSISLAYADSSSLTLGQNGVPDEQTVVANCHAAQTLLGQIERSDSVMRVNRGQDYNDIQNLLFAMNARIASNNISAPKLADLVNSFQDELTNFRAEYDKYDDSLNKLTSDNCTSDPTSFYSDLMNARTLTTSLNQSVANLDTIIANYKAELANTLNENSGARS